MPLTTEVHASTVIGVPSYAAAGAFTDTLAIKEYGQSTIIACCILETPSEPTAIGTVRRIVLSLPNFESTVLREKLVSVEHSVQRTRVRMDYVPFGPEEAHRSPIGLEGTKKLKSASTLITVSEVTTNPNTCFVEMATTLVLDVDVAPNGAIHADDNNAYCLIETFWKMYLARTVTALEDHLLSIAFPLIAHAAGERLNKDFTEIEDVVCEWSAKTTENISRMDALQLLERSLIGWERVRRELQHQKMISARLQSDVDGARAVAAAAAQSAAAAMVSNMCAHAEAEAEAEAVSHPPNPPPRTAAPPSQLRTKLVTPSVTNNSEAVNALKQLESELRVPFFEPGGGHRLSVSHDEGVLIPSQHQTQEQQQDAPTHRPSPIPIDAKLIHDVVSHGRGTVNEREAEVLFSVLDEAGKGFIEEKQIARVLEHIDPLGLYEDRDGTIQHMSECRAAVGTGIFRHDERPPSTADSEKAWAAAKTEAEESLKTGGAAGTEPLTALQALIRRHDMQKSLMYREHICKRSKELVSKFAYKARGKIHYDEFCLMMLHLLRDY